MDENTTSSRPILIQGKSLFYKIFLRHKIKRLFFRLSLQCFFNNFIKKRNNLKKRIHLPQIAIASCCLLSILLLFTHCSTRKNTGLNRAYHTTTSHFNINFNAKEALKKAETTLEENQKDNYTTQLPVYVYPPKEAISGALSSLDRTIEKSSKSIFKHSIFIKGKEYVKTMDDAYLLMGKAYFYKQDYTQAQRIFNYIIT